MQGGDHDGDDDGRASRPGSAVAACDDRARWLMAEVIPHEAAVRRWLGRGRNLPADIDDIIQESYAKLVGVADPSHIQNVRAYFFRTAHSVVASRLRRKSVVSIEALAEKEGLYEGIDVLTPEDIAVGRNELQILAEMMQRLPEKTRRIFVLSRVIGLTQKEIASRTHVPESTVEKHIAKGIRLLTEAYSVGGYGAVIASRLDRSDRRRPTFDRQKNANGPGGKSRD